jgi:hypothetical protein
MNSIRRKVNSRQIMESLIVCFEELEKRKENLNRYTKFDSDNDLFLGPLGEKVFFNFLEESGYFYQKDFIDNKCLEEKDKSIINGIEYDHFDFKLKYGNNFFKIDLKTQYCFNLDLYDEYWQMAVNYQTIEKIKTGKRNLDYFVFIFSDKKFNDYKLHLEKKLKTNNINIILNWLKLNLINSEKYFKDFFVDIVGIINTKHFISCSNLFKENEIFRINFNNNGKALIWKSEADMYRVYIKYLNDFYKEFSLKDISFLNIEDKNEFKIWFETIYKINSDFFEVFIGENIFIKIPIGGFLNGMQFKNYIEFYKSVYNNFKKRN